MSRNAKLYQGVRGKKMLGLTNKDVIAANSKQKQTESASPNSSTTHANTDTPVSKRKPRESMKRNLSKHDDTGPTYPKRQQTESVQKTLATRAAVTINIKKVTDNVKRSSSRAIVSTSNINTRCCSMEDLNLIKLIPLKNSDGHKYNNMSLSDLTIDAPWSSKKKRSSSVPAFCKYEDDFTVPECREMMKSPDCKEEKHLNFFHCNIGSNFNGNYKKRECLSLSDLTQDYCTLGKVSKSQSEPTLRTAFNFGNISKETTESSSSISRQKSLSMSDLTCDTIGRITSAKRWQSLCLFDENTTYDCDRTLFELYKIFSEPSDSNSPSEVHDECHENVDCLEEDINKSNKDRKRQKKADESAWKKNNAKRQRMLGEEYLGYSKPANRKMEQNVIRPAREIGERCSSDFCRRSKLRGCDRLTEETRLDIHQNFWKRLNWDQRKVYVANYVKRTNTGRKTKSSEGSRRGETLFYYLPLTREGTERIQVCREMFLNTLSLGSFTVQSWTKQVDYGMVTNKEEAMSSRNRELRVEVNRKALTANNFLDNIPKLPSHYARKETTKLFLEPSYHNLRQLFNDYKTYCRENEEPQVSRYTFEKLFHEKNLSLYTLKKDMCDTCSAHKAGNVNEVDYKAHIKRKDRARKEKENDKNAAESKDLIVLTVDLEAVKVCPYLTASALYFKTKLTCHNYTVYDLTTNDCCCYWFDETAADLTANTFTSLLVDYLERKCIPRNLPIIIYSDGCTYQNRNAILSNALLNLSMRHGITITQKYLERGHTQMECDSVHATIERRLKNREIHLPSDYVSITKEARQTPYETVLVEYDFVKDYCKDTNLYYKSIRPGKKAGDPQVTEIRAIMYEPNADIKVKLHFDDEWTDLPQRPRRVTPTYNQLRFEPIALKLSKFNHLQQLKVVLPKDCHPFYDNLRHE